MRRIALGVLLAGGLAGCFDTHAHTPGAPEGAGPRFPASTGGVHPTMHHRAGGGGPPAHAGSDRPVPTDAGAAGAPPTDAGRDAGYGASDASTPQCQQLADADAGVDADAPIAPKGRLKLGTGGKTIGPGDFDSSVVVRTIKRHARTLLACYEDALRLNPTLEGRIALAFTIDTGGTTSDIVLSNDTLCSASVSECITRMVNGFSFNPGPEGGEARFAYSFAFSPVSP